MKTEKIKLFLVDDDALLLKSLEIEFLQHADFEIETFPTGELCIKNLDKNPDIIVLDEGLSVGDLSFQEKCQKYFDNYFKSGKTLIVCLHALDFIKNNCNRVLIMNEGKIISDGPISLIEKYENQTIG